MYQVNSSICLKSHSTNIQSTVTLTSKLFQVHVFLKMSLHIKVTATPDTVELNM